MSRPPGSVPIALVAALALAACKGKGERVVRGKDAAGPVAVVDRTAGPEVSLTPEVEPNDDPAHAGALAPGGGAQGTLAGDADRDVYKLRVDQPAMIALALDAIDADLILEVATADGTLLARSDRGPARTAEGMPNLGLGRGDYLVTVRAFVKAARKPKPPRTKPRKGEPPPPDAAPPPVIESAAYHLTAAVVATADATEREPDDDTGAASEVFLGDSVHGWVGWGGDVDLWKLSLEGLGQRNALDLDVSGAPGVALTVELLDGAGHTLLSRRGAKGAAVAIGRVQAAIADGQPPYHYVKIAGDRSNPTEGYTLTVTGRVLDLDEEAEPNDQPERATALTADATATSGTMRAAYAPGDVDWFTLAAATEDTLLDLTVEAPPDVDLAITARTDTGVLGSADAGKAGVRERLSVTVPAGAPVRVQISARADKRAPTEPRDYQVRWSLSPAAPPMPPEESDPGVDAGVDPE